MSGMFLLTIALPLTAAFITFAADKKSANLRDGIAVCAAALSLLGALSLFLTGGRASNVGFCGLGLTFASGGLRSLMSLLAGIIWLGSELMSIEYFAGHQRTGRYQLFSLLTLGATQGAFLSDDLYTLFIFFEMMSFCSYPLVKHEETEKALRAGQTYLAISVGTGLVTLCGIFCLYAQTRALSFDALTAISDKSSLYLPGALILTGFAAKAGLFPLHVWLPEAHPAAPAPASALLSCILTKVGVFGVLILSCRLFKGDPRWGVLLLVPAAITMLLGAVLALLSTDLKRTLACSSLSQIGFVLVGVSMQCLLGADGAVAAAGTVAHILNHALIKLTLFGCAGVVYKNLHALDLNEVRGFGRDKPLLGACFLLCALAIGGVPGFGGYVSKTLLHESLLTYHGEYRGLVKAVEVVFLLSGGLTCAYMAKLFVALFVEKGKAREKKKYMTPVTLSVLAFGAILMPLFGLLPHQTLEVLAARASEFMGAGVESGVPYYSLENLSGALISLIVGAAAYFGVVRVFLMEDGRYVNRLPASISLENAVYRPLIGHVLPTALAFVARLFAGIPDALLFPLRKYVFPESEQRIDPPGDDLFSVYPQEPFLRRGFTDTLAFSFMMLGVGLVAALLYLLWH